MFIETYYDERALAPTSRGEPAIPYPELRGEDLILWQRYLPAKREIKSTLWWLYETAPDTVVEELVKAKKVRLFDRIEIWSRSADPMAVGVIGGGKTRYFSIVRWGDAKLTLEQVKKRLRAEEWMFWLAPVGGMLVCLTVILAVLASV